MRKKKQRLGRPAIAEETKLLVLQLYNEDKLTCNEIAKACRISKASLYRIVRENERRRESNEAETTKEATHGGNCE